MEQRIGEAVLQLRWRVDAAQLGEFERWYDEEHLADVVGLPGVLGGRRFRRVGDVPYASASPFDHITVYQLQSEAVLDTPAYLELARNPSPWTRKVAFGLEMSRQVYRQAFPDLGSCTRHAARPDRQPIGRAMLHVTMQVEAAHAEELSRWHEQEHVPRLVAVDGVLSARRFAECPPRSAPGTLAALAIYELADVAVATSPALLDASRPTPWRRRLGQAFVSDVQVYRQVFPPRGAKSGRGRALVPRP